MRFLVGPWSPVGAALSVLRERRRSLSGGGACASGGVGSCACDEAGGVMGSWAMEGVAGLVRRDCRERHVEKMLPMAVCGETWGGLAGGEVKSAA